MSSADAASTRTRGFKKKERTRRLLLTAAVEEIALTGEAFTVLDVTKRADVSNGTFYNYFDDRDALIDAVIAEVLTSFTDTSAERVTFDDPVRRFATITALLLEQSAANPHLATVLMRLHSATHIDTSTSDPFRHLRNDLAEAAAQGRLAQEPTDAAVDLVTGTLSRAVLRLTTADLPGAYRRELIALLLKGFGLDAGEADEIAGEAVAIAPELALAYRAGGSP
ncbi:MAG: TetR/AcrR family transcriptional regulator [Actinomycetota bacterium]